MLGDIMKCPKCKKDMSECVVGNDESDAVYFNNCSDCYLQIDNEGYSLDINGNSAIRIKKVI